MTCILTSIAVSQGIYVHLRYIVRLTLLSWLVSYINWLHCPFNLIILTCILHTLNFFVHLSWLSWLASYIHWLLCPINLIILTCILHTLNSMFPNYVCTRGCHLMSARWSPITQYIVLYPDLLAVGGVTRDMSACIVR